MYNLKSLLAGILMLITFATSAQKMNNSRLEKVITGFVDTISGRPGYWEIRYNKLPIIVITDESHNRMRMIAAIIYLEDIDEDYYLEALEANFHTALDVKYAVSDSIVWTVFIHPLKELSDNQVKDAIKQLYFGTMTFGEGYTSTDLVFPAKAEEEE